MKLLDVKETQNILRTGRDKTYSLMRSRSFPSIKIGGRYYVDDEALQEWIRNYRYKEFLI